MNILKYLFMFSPVWFFSFVSQHNIVNDAISVAEFYFFFNYVDDVIATANY
jgi:hypothetical protein